MGKHKEWRKIAKKLRRKRIRSKKAQERDRLLKLEEERLASSPSYQAWLREQESLEEFKEQEEERLSLENHKKWLELEETAQEAWREKQRRALLAKEEKQRQIAIIKEKLKEEEEKKTAEAEKEKEEKERVFVQKENFKKAILDYINGVADELPPEMQQTSQTQPGKEECPFFSKVGACRFFERCSRNHSRPGASKILLFQGLYSHFSLFNHSSHAREYDTDISLEYDNTETYTHFDEFFNDIVNEINLFGRIKLVKVCKNSEIHLRGNVYVQFKTVRDALKAYCSLHGRYYAGKQLTPVFVTIPMWRNALCGQQRSKKCHKGNLCNFLHVFSNPYGKYSRYDDSTDSESPNNRWSSESPEEKSHKRSRKSHSERQRSRDRSSRRRQSSSYRDKDRDRTKESDKNRNSQSSRLRREDKEHRNRSNHSSRRESRDSHKSKRDASAWNDNKAPGWSSSEDETERVKSKNRRKKNKSKKSDHG